MTNIFTERLSVEITDACNLSCRSCPRRGGSTYMDGKQFQLILGKVGAPDRVFFHWFCEPTLHPHLPAFVASAKSAGAKDTYVSTNSSTHNLRCGKYVRALFEHLDRITYCVDGFDQASLTSYRVGANFDNVMRALRMAHRMGMDSPWIKKRMRVLMFKWNDTKEEWFRNLARNHGFDEISFASPHALCKRVLSADEALEWLPANPKYLRYKWDGYSFVHADKPFCSVGPPLITANGDVCACQWDSQHRYTVGNIFDDSLDVIEGRFNRLREVMRNRKFDICKECLCNPSTIVDYIEDLRQQK